MINTFEKQLVGIYKNQEYFSARGVYDTIPYRIIEQDGKFLLERLILAVGFGMVPCPIKFFDDGWKGMYSVSR